MNPPPDLFPNRPVRSDFATRAPSYRMRRILTVTVLLCVLGAGLRFFFSGSSLMHSGEIATIKAEGSWKQRPNAPGGLDIPNQNVQVYQALDNKDEVKTPTDHLLPPPENPEPVTGATPHAQTTVVQAPANANDAPRIENLAPPKLDIDSIPTTVIGTAPSGKVENLAAPVSVPGTGGGAGDPTAADPKQNSASLPAPITDVGSATAAPTATGTAVSGSVLTGVAPAPLPAPATAVEIGNSVSAAGHTTGNRVSAAPISDQGASDKVPTDVAMGVAPLAPAALHTSGASQHTAKPKTLTIDDVLKDVDGAPKSDRIVQLASVQDEATAQAMAEKLQIRYASILGSAQLRLVRANVAGKGTYFRIQSQPVTDDHANGICSELKKMKAGCFLVRP